MHGSSCVKLRAAITENSKHEAASRFEILRGQLLATKHRPGARGRRPARTLARGRGKAERAPRQGGAEEGTQALQGSEARGQAGTQALGRGTQGMEAGAAQGTAQHPQAEAGCGKAAPHGGGERKACCCRVEARASDQGPRGIPACRQEPRRGASRASSRQARDASREGSTQATRGTQGRSHAPGRPGTCGKPGAPGECAKRGALGKPDTSAAAITSPAGTPGTNPAAQRSEICGRGPGTSAGQVLLGYGQRPSFTHHARCQRWQRQRRVEQRLGKGGNRAVERGCRARRARRLSPWCGRSA